VLVVADLAAAWWHANHDIADVRTTARQLLCDSTGFSGLSTHPAKDDVTSALSVCVCTCLVLQLRSLENHLPMPGVTVGDIGPKFGFGGVDNGYMSMDHVRIRK
jgi:hypothetical protein